MGRRWPQSRTWVVVPTSATADWSLVTTVLAAAATARVAVVGVGIGAPPGERLLAHVATWADLHDGDRDPLRLADALRIIDAVAHAHDLVLVVGAGGLLVPTGRTGWTMADLAAALGAPVVVVVGDDPRGVNYTTVEALEARGLASALVAVGEPPKSLPIEPAGRIPAGVDEVEPEAARGYLDPTLHAVPDGLRTGPRRTVGRAPVQGEWPDSGPWVVAPTSATADRETAATALAAASAARVAAVAFGAPGPPGKALAAHLGSWVGLRDGAEDPLRLADALAVTEALARTHELVLVLGAADALAPTGRAGWTLLDLAEALGAPVIVVTGDDPHPAAAVATDSTAGAATDGGPAALADTDPRGAGGSDATVVAGDGRPAIAGDDPRSTADQADNADQADDADHVARTIGAIEGRGLAAAVVTVGGSAAGDRLPVVPAGRIPADAGDLDADAARALLDPKLHATPSAVPPPPPVPVRTRTASSRAGVVRAVLLVLLAAVIMSAGAVGLAYRNRAIPDPQPPTGISIPEAEEMRPDAEDGEAAWADLCPQFRLAGEPIRPGADVTARVDAAWTRIETWLAGRAPGTYRSLLPPADPADVDAAQRRMSVAFPPDLVASLLRHDGADSAGPVFPPGFRPMTIREIVGDRAMLCDIISENPDLDDYWWSSDVVPIADAGTGDYLLVDQRPGSHGRVGLLRHDDRMTFEATPASMIELLEQTATSLETGRPLTGDARPVVQDGFLSWR